MKTYLALLFGSAILAAVITPLLVRLATALGLVDAPGVRKVHAGSIPRIGGIAIVVPTIVLTMAVLALDNRLGELLREIHLQAITFLVAASGVFLVGLLDDLYDLSAKFKLIVQVAAAIAVCSSGVVIERFAPFPGFEVEFGWVAYPLTVLWIVGITNAVNLIDGLDGLAAGISALACATVAAVALATGQEILTIFSLALLGGLVGFLFYNFNPAKIFLGDSGSLFLGFTIASVTVMTSHKRTAFVALAIPVLALGVPIFDTLLSMLRRYLERRPIFAPDRSHIHHKLLEKGISHRRVVLTLYGVTLLATSAGILMLLLDRAWHVLLFAAGLIGLLVTFRAFGLISVRTTFSAMQENRLLARERRSELRSFHRRQLEIRHASDADEWWNTLCSAAADLGFPEMSLSSAEPLRAPAHLHSSRSASVFPTLCHTRHSAITVPVRIANTDFTLTVTLPHDHPALEPIFRRLTLLVRLIDDSPLHILQPRISDRDTLHASPLNPPFDSHTASPTPASVTTTSRA